MFKITHTHVFELFVASSAGERVRAFVNLLTYIVQVHEKYLEY